jgi:hypothetical protein
MTLLSLFRGRGSDSQVEIRSQQVKTDPLKKVPMPAAGGARHGEMAI